MLGLYDDINMLAEIDNKFLPHTNMNVRPYRQTVWLLPPNNLYQCDWSGCCYNLCGFIVQSVLRIVFTLNLLVKYVYLLARWSYVLLFTEMISPVLHSRVDLHFLQVNRMSVCKQLCCLWGFSLLTISSNKYYIPLNVRWQSDWNKSIIILWSLIILNSLSFNVLQSFYHISCTSLP